MAKKLKTYRIMYTVTRAEYYDIDAKNKRDAEERGFGEGLLVKEADATNVECWGMERRSTPVAKAKGGDQWTASLNTIVQGNCIDVMSAMPAGSIDFILTDPPYLAAYRSRNNQTLINDDNAAWLTASCAQMHRVLKNDACAISFYGWPKVDLFFAAWKGAGFRIGGHIVFRKRYTSKSAFLQYRHEAAYLLLKGNPALPATPLPDVMDWTYTGNKLHPTQKSIHILKPLIEAFTNPRDLVLDPFAGSGSVCVAARRIGRQFVGIELDTAHYRTATARIAKEPGHSVDATLARQDKPAA